MVVICVSGDVWLECHAAEELAKYIEAMTNIKPEITCKVLPTLTDKVVVSVGESSIAESLVEKGLIKPVGKELGEDGFVIKSTREGDNAYLVLLGGSPRGTLYAVYHYLEAVCKIGFFWDGETIPKLREIPYEDIDLTERPRFKERQYLQGCVFGYTTYYWGWNEWKREVDWAAKHKMNILAPLGGIEPVWMKVWKTFGVEVSPQNLTGPPFVTWAYGTDLALRPPYPLDWMKYQGNLAKQIMDYARSLGMKIPSVSWEGAVPREFPAIYPHQRYVKTTWADFPVTLLYPTDPLFSALEAVFLEKYIERYSTDHMYWLGSYGEMRPGDTPEERTAIKTDVSRRMQRLIKSVDPNALFLVGSWTFVDREYWSKDDVKAYLDSIPTEECRVWELWPEFSWAQPMYKELDYYFGKYWLMGFLHSFGGHTTLHGDLPGLIGRVKEVSHDPKADRCLGLAIQMEVIHHNHIFYDLLAKLAWNPEAIELESFLEDYALRRYGKASAGGMVQCLKELIMGVYSSDDVTSPLYQFRLGERLLGYHITTRVPPRLSLSEREKFIPHLQRALEFALGEAVSLWDNPMYVHDVMDVAKQFLGELFNSHIMKLSDAFNKGDAGAFESEAKAVADMMDSLKMLLSSHSDYCLQPILDKALSLPNAPKDMDEKIRDILTVWAGHIPDYARRDYYELVRFYYRPRVNVFVETLRRKLREGERKIVDKELEPLYNEVEQNFVKRGFEVKPGERFQGTPLEAAKTILEKHKT